MSDNPNELKKILLGDLSTEQSRELAKMIAEECAVQEIQDKGHRCWYFIPTATEYEKMTKYNEKCPKCNDRIYVEVFHGNFALFLN